MTTASDPSAFQADSLPLAAPTASTALADETATTVRRAPSRRSIGIAAGLAALVAGAGWYATTLGHESTDDAQIDAEIVAVPARTAGTVKKLDFVENQHVKEGDLLAELDDEAPRARLAQAQASLDAAQAAAAAADADADVAATNARGNKAAADASLVSASTGAVSATDQIREAEAALRSAEATRAQAKTDRDRTAKLAADGAVAPASLEQADTALALASSNADGARARLATLTTGRAQASSRVAEAQARATQSNNVPALVAQAQARAASAHAQVDTARAARDLAALDLSYTRILAPHDGVVSKKVIAEGQNVSAGQSVVQLVTPGVWVTANFKETQLEHMRPGQSVTFSVDAFPSTSIRGAVESFSGGTGSKFTLLPPDNASGNFTKVVQRVPVRIKIGEVPADLPLLPGMSVDVRVDTRS
jgi:membrane fusion protein (multidrug efflux system)